MCAIEFFIAVSSFLGTMASSTVLFKILSLNFTDFSLVVISFVIGALAGSTPSFKPAAKPSKLNIGENTNVNKIKDVIIFLNIQISFIL